MASQGIESYRTRIYQAVFGLVFLTVIFISFKGMISGHSRILLTLGAMFALFAVYFWLDSYYWLLCPALMNLGRKIPGLPFEAYEIGALLLYAFYFLRNAMHKEASVKWDFRLLIALPAFLWIMMVMCINPAGIAILGTESIGGRFYVRVFIGFIGLLALSTRRFSENDCRILFFVLLGMSMLAMASTILRGFGGGSDIFIYTGDEDQTNHYELLGAVTLYSLAFSRYSISDFLRSMPRLFMVATLFAVSVFTGKRAAMGRVIIFPVLRVFLTKRDAATTFCCGAIAVVMLALTAVGDGVFFELPDSARRAMSIVVPKFSNGAARGLKDTFRDGMRREARRVISENPLLGRKGFVMDRDSTAWARFGGVRGKGTNSYIHGLSGNWHSTWYAFAADFGLPCLLFWVMFQIYLVRFIFKSAAWCTTLGVFRSACFLYYSFNILIDVLLSYTSGHSALTSFNTWINYGFMLAIVQGAVDEWLQLRAVPSSTCATEMSAA